MKGKRVEDSKVVMTELVLPSHTNALGTIFGGQLMAWIDIAAATVSMRHARMTCVTASIDALHFVEPVKLGEIVCIFASVNFTGRTSMEVGVRLESEDPTTGEHKHVATSYLTFVAVDDKGRPKPIPAVLPETDVEKRRFREAQVRRQSRLALKEQLKKEP
jgi:acyl-CoA hydrolase